MASVAAVIQSQVSQLALVSSESDLPSSEIDSSAQETFLSLTCLISTSDVLLRMRKILPSRMSHC